MDSSVTYSQLNEVLIRLGFDRQEVNGKHLVYYNEQHDAMVTFPDVDLEKQAWPPHLLVAHKMVVERGVADEQTWISTLQKCGVTLPFSVTMKRVRYSDLENVLLRLGFKKHVIANAHVWFEHPNGAVFATRLYTPDELPREIIVTSARSTVNDWGIAAQDTFDRLLAESVMEPV